MAEGLLEEPASEARSAKGVRFELEGVSTEANATSRLVIGAAIEVHRMLGPGFIESVYERALCIELRRQAIAFVSQAPIEVGYKGELVGEGRVDLLVERCVIVELKAAEAIAGVHIAQVRSYLRATGLQLGLVVNFNVPRLREGGIRRVVNL